MRFLLGPFSFDEYFVVFESAPPAGCRVRSFLNLRERPVDVSIGESTYENMMQIAYENVVVHVLDNLHASNL